jgi:hypothetical protein
MTPYDKLIARKRKWTPVQMTAGVMTEGAEEALMRALALRQLEIPVGDFISNSLKGDIPENAREILEMNVIDEENHDLALGYAANALGVDEKAEREATALTRAWIAHPDHTICKAMVLERAVFFTILPFFRAFGDAGLRTISADISRDEQIHVATNSLVCRELGLTPSPTLDKLRKATVNWVFEPLKGVEKMDKKFWTDSSDRLMYQGKAPELSFTQSARMPSFFEHSNVNLPSYA